MGCKGNCAHLFRVRQAVNWATSAAPVWIIHYPHPYPTIPLHYLCSLRVSDAIPSILVRKNSWSLCLWEDLLLDISVDSLSILSEDILSLQHFWSHSLLENLNSTTFPFSYCLRYLKPPLLCWIVLSLNFYSLFISNFSLKSPNTPAAQMPHKLWF